MKKRVAKVKYIWLTIFCAGVAFGCAPDPDAELSAGLSEHTAVEDIETAQQRTEETEEESSAQASETAVEHSQEQQMQENVDRFYEEAKEQGIAWEEAAKYVQMLTEDDIFQGGAMAFTGLRMDDIDGNGQTDMLVMVLDAQEMPFYGSGALWIYMNEDEPYCFAEEYCSYYGWFDVFWDDIDNDENVEIVFSAQGTGCGAVGDSYKAVFKYRKPSADAAEQDSETDNGGNRRQNREEGVKNHIEQMKLPSDFTVDYDFGIGVEVYQEPEAGRYTAYCPYFDEKIAFRGQNIEDWSLPETAEVVGGEVRGFYNLRAVQYEGKKVLQASEYLNGEGGTVHNVATAQFLITWREDGTPEVIKWWVEEDKICSLPLAD